MIFSIEFHIPKLTNLREAIVLRKKLRQETQI